jgi:hypothetical protein
MTSAAARNWLARTPRDPNKTKQLLEDVEHACFRASEVLENVIALFKDDDHETTIDRREQLGS